MPLPVPALLTLTKRGGSRNQIALEDVLGTVVVVRDQVAGRATKDDVAAVGADQHRRGISEPEG